MIVLIPAYEPDVQLVRLVDRLRSADDAGAVIVVDDGSGPRYKAVFRAVQLLGAELITLPVNQGKGAALKAGIRHAIEHHPGHGVVTADSDGQHTVVDILRVGSRLHDEAEARGSGGAPDPIVLGVRAFAGTVPARSRLGNAVSAWIFRLASGFAVSDTQTGLRGLPASALRWALSVPGRRFEYELEMLLGSKDAGIAIVELPIETVYLERNASSHFRPLRDSVRVMRPMLRFAASSLLSFGIDTVLVQLMFWLTGSLLASVVLARIGSGGVNFALNRAAFGARGASLRRALTSYIALAAVLLAANYAWLILLTGAGLALVPAKILTEIALYVVSFAVQRCVVFARTASGRGLSRRSARSMSVSSTAHRKSKAPDGGMELATGARTPVRPTIRPTVRTTAPAAAQTLVPTATNRRIHP
ncbi:bifunctional glycosyltransferase family 2/GtrA family protein [Naasia lichenicola]|uniref:Glycosyltransferase n=1 Tax=Naasia lichenicola TaxID=2565933 RepID=A0A4S4FSX9_9MICO|nr:bifunctional glycosyltransferase family 2/GtrA family protein [Naasia lichenicola]THG33524.1 glycosyltransferase [Naasia lichenicola]